MRDTSFVLSLIAGLFLTVAAVAWFRIIRKPDRVPPTEKNLKRGNMAAMIIVVAFAFSVVAALVAVVGWIQR